MFHKDLEHHVASGHGGELILDAGKITSDQCKQVAWFGMRIMPNHKVPSIRKFASLFEIAIRKQYGGFSFVGFDTGRIDGHNVRPVRKVGDTAKAFGLALGAIATV